MGNPRLSSTWISVKHKIKKPKQLKTKIKITVTNLKESIGFLDTKGYCSDDGRVSLDFTTPKQRIVQAQLRYTNIEVKQLNDV